MGIKLLNKFLKEKCTSLHSVCPIHISKLSNKIIAVDISIYLYKYESDNTLIENIYTKPTNEAYINAKNNFIIEAFTISNNIETIKEWLDKNEPIATGIPIYSNFISSKTGIIENPNKSDKLLGGHAVIICGYNDFDERFIMRNSWGTYWGDNGYFYLSYSYILNINNIELWIISKSKFYSQ
jgi:C1A family cysteine protease